MTAASRAGVLLPPRPELCAVARCAVRLGGDERWADELPALVRTMEHRWSMRVGAPFAVATEAYVARARLADGTPVVLKLTPPSAHRRDGPRSTFDDQLEALRLGDGRGCVRLLRHDRARGAVLLERLGPSLAERHLPRPDRTRILVAATQAFWRPVAPGHRLPTGAEQAVGLASYVVRTWNSLRRPCTARAVEHALVAARNRALAHDDGRAVLVHGDVHQWNALAAGDGYRLVDPHGLVAEPEFDLGVVMREDPLDLMRTGAQARVEELATLTGGDPIAIREWGVLQRVATGLLCTSLGMPVGAPMLAAADAVAARPSPEERGVSAQPPSPGTMSSRA